MILSKITVASDATPPMLELKNSGITAASLVDRVNVIVLTIPSRNIASLWRPPPAW